jgi:hypothetical protein
MKQYGFTNNVELTNTLRSVSTMNQHKKKKAFVRNRGLVFINDN